MLTIHMPAPREQYANDHEYSDDSSRKFSGSIGSASEPEFRELVAQLPATDVALLDQLTPSKPLTTDILLAATLCCVETSNRKWLQNTLRKLDPLFVHIKSFSSIVDIFVQTNPTIPGLIWGSLHLAITVCCRSMALFARFVDMLADFAPVLSFFSRSKELFEHMDSRELEAAVKAVCKEIVLFCLAVVRHCNRNPFTNLWRMLLQRSLEAEFRQYSQRLAKQIALADKEVCMCGMRATQQGIHEVQNLNERFFGRHAVLEEMSVALDPALLPKKQRKFALYGLAGFGKTQVALEFVYRHYDKYKVILWLSSSSIEKLEKDFADAALHLGLGKPLKHANEARQFVLQRLCDIDASDLMVFDNVEDIALIRPYWPRTNHGSIIITSRDSVMSRREFSSSALVPEFTIDDGYKFLTRLLGNCAASAAESDLRETSTILGGHPLALVQAAAYILTEDSQVGAFLKAYHHQRRQLDILNSTLSDYEHDLSTMWKLSFSTLTAESQYLLDILTFFDPDGVPYKLLTEGALTVAHFSPSGSKLSQPQEPSIVLTDQADFSTLLQILRKQSLIRTNARSSSFTIHRLVQEYASQRLRDNKQREHRVFADALSLLGSMQPKDDCTKHWSPHLWDTALIYLPHVRALESRYWNDPAAFRGYENSLAGLLFNCANYMFERNRYNMGLEIISSARKAAETAPSPDYKLLSDLHRLEGRLCNEANLPQRGQEAFQTAFSLARHAIDVGQLEPNDTRCVRTITGWGNCLNQTGYFDEALRLQLQASQTCAEDPEKHGDAQSIVMLNLGYVYFRRGNLDKAEATLREAQKQDTKLQPVPYALGNMAILRGQVADGLNLHLEALRLYMDEFGEQHHCVADSLFKVGETYLKMHLIPEALAHLHKSLAMYRSEGQHFDARAAISRGARTLALALQRHQPGKNTDGQAPKSDMPSPDDLLEEAFNLHQELTGQVGSMADTDDDYSSLMFYWSR